jgi:ribonuclease PH
VVADPIIDHVAAVSCGLYGGVPILDLDYAEDSVAGTDGNFVLTGSGRMVEIQASAEGATFGQSDLATMLALAAQGTAALVQAQKAATE